MYLITHSSKCTNCVLFVWSFCWITEWQLKLFVKNLYNGFACFMSLTSFKKNIFQLSEVFNKRLVLIEMFLDTYISGKKNYFICNDTSVKDWNICLAELLFFCTDTLVKDWNICLPELFFMGISKKLGTHLRGEAHDPRSEKLSVIRPKSLDTHSIYKQSHFSVQP